MKFLLDENIGKEIALFLEKQGYTTLRVKLLNPGITDTEVLDLAIAHDAILVTSDKGFGDLIFKKRKNPPGFILLRLKNDTSSNKITAIRFLFSKHQIIYGNFIVINQFEGNFRIRIKII